MSVQQLSAMVATSAFKANSEIDFTTRCGSNQVPKIKGLKIHFRIAYKVGTDMEQEVKTL